MSEKAGEKPEEKTVPKSSEPASPEDSPVSHDSPDHTIKVKKEEWMQWKCLFLES